MEHVVGHEQEKEEHEHGIRFMFVDMICVPLVNQLIESVVFYPPPGMSHTDNSPCFSCRLGYVRCPNPFRDRLLVFIGETAMDDGCFNGPDHANRIFELLPCREPLYIPTLIERFARFEVHRRLTLE